MTHKRRITSDGVEILHHLLIGTNPDRLLELEEARADGRIARLIRQLRTLAGLTQAQLGKKLGVKAQLIDDLEDADYEGNMLAMLQRIAEVLGKEVEVRIVSAKRKRTLA